MCIRDRVKAGLKKELGRTPNREEIAKRMRIAEAEVEDLEILGSRDISLSDRYFDEDIEFGDKIEDSLSPSVEYSIIKNSFQEQIREILHELDDKEALVLKLRFGLDDDEPRTLQEIGDQINMTRERIRQIEKKAMRKLARQPSLQQLRGSLN